MRTSTKAIAALAIVGTAAAVVAVFNIEPSTVASRFLAEKDDIDQETVDEFNKFISKNKRNYKTQDEFKKRQKIFKKALKTIKEHNNKKDQSSKMAINAIADLTEDELKQLSGYKPAPIGDDNEPYLEYDETKGRNLQIATSIDWRALGKVTEVKD